VPDLVVEPTTYAEYLSTVKVRRVNTLLSTARLEDVTGYEPDDLRERFRDCLLRYGETDAVWAPSRV
jgi:hypothetical protein